MIRPQYAGAGGAGIYYHFDYVGGPRNYKWINTNPIPKVWEQLTLAKEYGADRIWIVNVGHFKGLEFPIEYFMHLAWNSQRGRASRTYGMNRFLVEKWGSVVRFTPSLRKPASSPAVGMWVI